MTYHKLLEKQLAKHWPKGYEPDEQCANFLTIISNAYTTFERDKKISEHAFDVSEHEYQQVLKDLKVENEIREQSVKKLKDAIRALDNNSLFLQEENADSNLIDVISYLEQQIIKTKELEGELVSAKIQAEQGAKAKSEFLSVISHEIRTPLNAIIGITHLLLQDDPQPWQTKNLNALQISSENLLSLINDVLDFGKIEDGKIILNEKNIDIRQLAQNIKTANQARAEDRGNKLKLLWDEDLPAIVKGDDLRLGQVLNNLVTNAIKFTKNGRVTIEIGLVKETGDEYDISFSVSDTGIGIAPEKQQMIFERFAQANSEITREYGGSGLGLAITKKLLNLYGTDIELSSTPGKGSTFSFNLHMKKGDASHRQKEKLRHVTEKTLEGIRILLVEDVEFNVMVAEAMLTKWKATVEVASNGIEAIEKVKAGTYDIILMDLQMPQMDGFTATRHIREINTVIPIIALTASASPDIEFKALNHAMSAYLSKPFSPGDLFDTVYGHVNAGKEEE
jgi:signal transduction histidine kinase/CheY-like chemotaxis protein